MKIGCLFLLTTLVLSFCEATLVEADDSSPGTMRVQTKQFKLPVKVADDFRSTLKEMQLFTSTDGGKTWKQVTSIPSTDKAFSFIAPRDGIYWLNVRFIKKDGTFEARNMVTSRPDLKVSVDTGDKGK